MTNQDYQWLLDINTAIATVKRREELLRIIFDKIKPVLGFYDVGLFVFSEDKKYLTDWAVRYDEISPSFGNEYLREQQSDTYLFAGSGFEELMSIIEKSNKPEVFSYRTGFFKDYLIAEQGKETHQELMGSGYDRFIATPLTYRRECQGFLFLNYQENEDFPDDKMLFLQAVIDQLVIAVVNILANERLLKEKEKTGDLLMISRAIATIKDRKELLKTIYQGIQPIFPFDNAGLFVLDETGDHHYELVDDEILTDDVQKTSEEQLGHGPFEHKNTSVAMFMNKGPVIINMREMASKYYHPQHELMEKSGLKQLIGGPLLVGGQKIGMVCFNSKTEGFYTNGDIPMFQNISDQLAVAVSNVLADEEIQRREREKSGLLKISEILAKAKTRKELLNAVFNEISIIFPFDDAGLFEVKPDGMHRDFVVDESLIYSQNTREAGFTGYLDRHSVIDYLTHDDNVSIHTFAWLKQNHPGHCHYPFIEEVGSKELISGPLSYKDEILGILCFWSKNEGFFRESQFDLFKQISNLLANAMANILASEQLFEEKEKTERLLEITRAIAQVNDQEDLFHKIYESLKPIFGFDDVVIVIREDDDMVRHLVGDAHKDVRELSVYEENIGKPFPIANSVYENIYGDRSQDIVHVSVHEMTERYPKHWGTKLAKEAGYEDWISTRLYSAGKLIGNLEFLSRKKDFFNGLNLSLFKNTANQLATAVANILANEQLLEEKQKTEELLTITEAIANINSFPELAKAILDKIQTVFPFDDAGLFQVDKTNERERDLFVDYGSTKSSEELRKEGLFGWQQLSEVAYIFSQKKPFTTSVESLFQAYNHPHFEYLANDGFKHLITGPLMNGEETIGFLCFWSKQENAFKNKMTLFKSISDQLSIVLNKIIANEEIAFRERFKSLQAGILSAFDTSFKPKENFKTIAMLLQDTVPFDMLAFSLYDKKNQTVEGHGYRIIGPDEYQYIDEKSFLNITNLDQAEFIKSWKSVEYKGTQFFNGPSFIESLERDPIKKVLHQKVGFQSSLISHLELNQGKILLITFFSMGETCYTQDHRNLVHRIVPSIRLAMDRILAYRDIKLLNESLKQEKNYLQEELKTNYNLHQIIGSSHVMKRVLEKVDLVVQTDTTVLVLGETGTGKELIARALHNASSRKDKPLVKVNCATLPSELVESELFGHEKGAFTGAHNKRIGKFELAHGGSIFLDEIGELPLELQSKLLRVIQEKEFERLGGNKTIKTDTRIIAATNRNLEEEVAEGRFRSDLYYRLSVFPIQLPPLRERPEDIEELIHHFLDKYTKKAGKPSLKLTKSDLSNARRYAWPGNVRELEHVAERSVLLSQKGSLQLVLESSSVRTVNKSGEGFKLKTLQEAEEELIYKTLEHTDGKIRGKNGAAEILGVHPSTLDYRIKRAGIVKKHVKGE